MKERQSKKVKKGERMRENEKERLNWIVSEWRMSHILLG
jgi:hypothetical protein